MRLQWAMVLAAVCLAVAIGAVAYGAGKASDVPEVIRAQRFELVDAEGKVRIELSMGEHSRSPRLSLCDENGLTRAKLAVGADGVTSLSFYDEKRNPLAVLSLLGSPSLILSDAKGNKHASLSNNSLMLFSETSEVSGVLLLHTFLGNPSLSLSDEKGTKRAVLSLPRDGIPSLALSDEKGDTRAEMGFDTGGEPTVRLRDEGGRVTYIAPPAYGVQMLGE